MATDKKTVRLHIPDMPEPLHRRMKAAAYRGGKTIKQFVFEAIEAKLNCKPIARASKKQVSDKNKKGA